MKGELEDMNATAFITTVSLALAEQAMRKDGITVATKGEYLFMEARSMLAALIGEVLSVCPKAEIREKLHGGFVVRAGHFIMAQEATATGTWEEAHAWTPYAVMD